MATTDDDSAPGTPVREEDDGPGRTIPTTTAPDASTGRAVAEEDPRWWFIGFAILGLVILAIALGVALL